MGIRRSCMRRRFTRALGASAAIAARLHVIGSLPVRVLHFYPAAFDIEGAAIQHFGPAHRANRGLQPRPAGLRSRGRAVLTWRPPPRRPSMAKFTYDHIHLRSPNPEATAQWYERVFGAEVVRTMQQGKPRIDLKLGGANVFIAPVAAGDGVNPPPVTPYQGLDHFGLTVSGIDAVVAELKAKGVEFTRDPTTVWPGTRVAFLRAPEGVSIELLDRNAS